jgi:hypothetical protein
MKLDDFYEDSVPLTITHRGRTVTIEAYPERATRELAEDCARMEGEQTGSGELHAMRTCVKSWSWEDPIDATTLRRMSPGLKRAIMQAVNMEANFPTEAASDGSSPNTSSGETSTAGDRTGTPSQVM